MNRLLHQAYHAYWAAETKDQSRAAYYEIIARGGNDGYPASDSRWRQWIGQKLRAAAAYIERRNG